MTLLVSALAEFHIVFAMIFLGVVFFLNIVLGPGLLMMSAALAKEFLNKVWPLSARFLHIAIGGTVLFGILLYFGGGFGSLAGNAKILLDIGMAVGLLAVIEGEALQIPAVNKLVKISNQVGVGGTSTAGYTPEQKELINKIKVGGIAGVLTMAVAAIMMIAAAWI